MASSIGNQFKTISLSNIDNTWTRTSQFVSAGGTHTLQKDCFLSAEITTSNNGEGSLLVNGIIVAQNGSYSRITQTCFLGWLTKGTIISTTGGGYTLNMISK